MTFKDWICQAFNCSGGCSISLGQCQKSLSNLQNQFNLVNDAKNHLSDLLHEAQRNLNKEVIENTQLANKISFLEMQLGGIKPVDVPTADITYERPVLIGKNSWEDAEIDVRLFCQPDFLIYNDLKKAGLIFDGTQELDKLIPTIYKFAKQKLPGYGDDSFYGLGNEYWQFPFEVRKQKEKNNKTDCEDNSHWIGAHFAAARIPANKWLISCGTTRSGFGHSTIYAKDKAGDFHHMNSTSPYSFKETLQEYPGNKDMADDIGIANDAFWFSFNSVYSLHKFETSFSKTQFNKTNLPIKIRRN